MKIISGDSVIAELRDAPKDFDCTNKAGVISVATPTGAVVIGTGRGIFNERERIALQDYYIDTWEETA